ncbi:cellulose binding domain-containing protein [Streptomyces sp. NPDC057002]|uniref:cellulose binding domain-containing protein n=1 Tax=Streptomyces sp. NPDC057002 TaxID=3345992 RepID=UPI00363CD191
MGRASPRSSEANRLHRRNFRMRRWHKAVMNACVTVSCVNASYNGSVPEGGSGTFGSNGSWSGSNPVPVVAPG